MPSLADKPPESIGEHVASSGTTCGRALRRCDYLALTMRASQAVRAGSVDKRGARCPVGEQTSGAFLIDGDRYPDARCGGDRPQRGADRSGPKRTIADEAGQFDFPLLPPGNFTLTVWAKELRPAAASTSGQTQNIKDSTVGRAQSETQTMDAAA